MEQQNDRPNPYTTIPDPFAAYKQSIDELLKDQPDLVEFGRYCYELFLVNENGKKLFKLLEERYLYQSLVNPTTPHANTSSMYWTGFTDCIKMFKQNALQHKQRIESHERND